MVAPTRSFILETVIFFQEYPRCAHEVEYCASIAWVLIVTGNFGELLKSDSQPLHCTHCSLLTALLHPAGQPAGSDGSRKCDFKTSEKPYLP